MAGTGNITADTGRIRNYASDIGTGASSFSNELNVLFEAVDALANSWTSVDGQAYIKKIDSYKPDFENLVNRLKATAGAFETVAENYETTVKNNSI